MREESCEIRLLQNPDDFDSACYVKFCTYPGKMFKMQMTGYSDDVSLFHFTSAFCSIVTPHVFQWFNTLHVHRYDDNDPYPNLEINPTYQYMTESDLDFTYSYPSNEDDEMLIKWEYDDADSMGANVTLNIWEAEYYGKFVLFFAHIALDRLGIGTVFAFS